MDGEVTAGGEGSREVAAHEDRLPVLGELALDAVVQQRPGLRNVVGLVEHQGLHPPEIDHPQDERQHEGRARREPGAANAVDHHGTNVDQRRVEPRWEDGWRR